jgi:uncharacterized protein (AIM24 family)
MGALFCRWCGTQFADARTCPACGAPSDLKTAVNDAGWMEQPPLPDMAKIQFGRSHAQIEGSQVPVVDLALAEGEGVYFTHDKLLWRDGTVKLSNLKRGGFFKRMRAGMPLVMVQADGPGRVACSDNHPGEIVAVPLNPASGIFAREHHMLLATHSVEFDGRNAYTSYTTQTGSGDDKEIETHYPLGLYVDVFHTEKTPGLVLLHAIGNVFVRNLAAGQSVDVSPHSVLAWDPNCSVELLIERTPLSMNGSSWGWFSNRYSGQHYLSVRLTGPGRVWIQSGTHGRTEEWRSITRTQNAIYA